MEKLAVCLTPQHHQDLKALLEHRGKPALSLYLPRSDAASAGFLLRQALHEAEAQLEEYELHSHESQALIRPLRDLREDPALARRIADGLALYVSEARSHCYFSAMTSERRVVVDDYFFVIPLITHHLSQRSFYLLDLNGPATLYHAGPGGLMPLPLATLADAAGLEALAAELRQFMLGRISPLLLVCRDPERFEHFCSLLEQAGIELTCHHCSADTLTLQGLQRQAWEQIAPRLRLEQAEALRDFEALRHTSKALQDIVSVAQAAYNSRVEKLFLVVAQSASQAINQHHHQLKGQTPQRRRMDELLNRAAIYTYLNGGEVYTVSPDQLEGADQAAAILRY